MNLKLLWTIWGLYNRITEVPKERWSGMGWKTITGATLVGLGYAAKMLVSVAPELDQVGDGLIALGAIIGGVGIRAAIAKGPSK